MVAPKLRFQEFDGDWAKSKLGDEAQFFQGEQVSLDDQYSEYSSGLTKFLRIENFTQKSKDFRYIKYSGSPEKILTETDIAIVRYGATAGFICSGETGVIANNLFKASVDNTKINQKYLELVLKSEKTFNYFQTAMSGGAMPALNFKIVGNLDITYSSILEQTKIASFLSAVDEKISQLTQKHALLSQYKQGMMQKLFSQQIRFKADDGSEFGEWQENQLLDLSTKKSSKVTAKDIEDNDGDYIVFGASGHFRNINSYTESEPYIAIVKDGAGAGRLFLMPEKSSVLGTLEIVKPNLNIQLNFLFYRMQLIDFSSYIKGSTIPHVYFKDYSQEKIYLPCLEEQTKIANFLSAIDQKIEVVAQQIEQAKQWKKGLLQQMFV
jgi:type I restriction enzyme S subunit